MSPILKKIKQELITHASAGNHDYYKKVVPGQQHIYGVKTPILNELVKKYKEGSFELAEQLWKSGWLEERVIAIKIIEKKGKDDPQRLLRLFKKLAPTIDNWAVCDGLGMQFLRGVVKTHAGEIFKIAGQYNRSPNSWLRRLSLVMVEWYTRDESFYPQIKALVKNLSEDDEYYVKKAVVWINRNFKNKR